MRYNLPTLGSGYNDDPVLIRQPILRFQDDFKSSARRTEWLIWVGSVSYRTWRRRLRQSIKLGLDNNLDTRYDLSE